MVCFPKWTSCSWSRLSSLEPSTSFTGSCLCFGVWFAVFFLSIAFWCSLYTLCVPHALFLALLIYLLFTYQKNCWPSIFITRATYLSWDSLGEVQENFRLKLMARWVLSSYNAFAKSVESLSTFPSLSSWHTMVSFFPPLASTNTQGGVWNGSSTNPALWLISLHNRHCPRWHEWHWTSPP